MKRVLAGLRGSPICRRNVFAALTGLLLGSISGSLLILWSNHYAPTIVHEEHELGTSTVSNGRIDIFFDLDRTRDCPAETSRWLWTWVDHGGEKIKQFFPLPNSTTTLSDQGRNQHFVLSLPLPVGIWPGHWFYWAKTVEHCSLVPSLIRSTIRETVNVPITILPEPN